MRKAALLPAILALAAVSPSLAQAPGVFQRFDKNGDGRITKDELPNPETFERFDINKDGAVTLEEFEQLMKLRTSSPTAVAKPVQPSMTAPSASQIDAIVKAVDKNGDGKITREEAAGAKWFDTVDRNGDGIIDAEELAFVKKMSAAHNAGKNPRVAPSNAPAIAPDDVKKVSSGPEILKPSDVGVGRMVADTEFVDLSGKTHRLSELNTHKGVVLVMTSATCPVSKRYVPSLAKLEKELDANDIALLLVNPIASEKLDDIKAQLADLAIAAPYVHDKDKSLTAALQARTTTEVFLLDATRTLVYRGALDDQYGVHYNLDAPRHHYLADAVSALLKGETPRIAATAAPGCELDLEGAAQSVSPVTYHRDVARILQQNCVKCHRDGGIAPFALDEPGEVKDRAKAIKRVISEGTMPPWFAAGTKENETNPWANDCSLASRDRADLIAWIESRDKPLGNASEAPAKRAYSEEWAIGKPDLIVPLSRAYDIKADGFMPYQFDVAETHLTEDRWVTAYEVLPSARDVVHHVIIRVHEKGADAKDREEGTGGYWAVYVPGNGSHIYPEGFARKIPAGARVSFQIHYTPSGKATKERLRLGLVFATTPPLYEVKTVAVANPKLAIPPGAAQHLETRAQRVPFDMPVTSFMAHMHVRGKAFKYEVTYPDGKSETLLDIPKYDFNWQLRYDLKQPKLIPRGSTLNITAIYDNSPANKANPDPSKLVKWGPQTIDEMMIGYVEYFTPATGATMAFK